MSRGDSARFAIVGGSGLYELAGVERPREVRLSTPFGEPSDVILIGGLAGCEVAFLARHGTNHRLLPSEINYRANLYALKTLGVERVLSVSAVGSMRERIRPRDVVLVDQFIDRTVHRAATFFGDGVAAHIAFGDPVCAETRSVLLAASKAQGVRAHDGGVYLCMEGPAFSTRAESRLYRSWGVDVIGMTNAQEAKLAREAEICYATMAMVTDYDCWHEEEQDVSIVGVLENLEANSLHAAEIVREAVRRLSEGPRGCACAEALRHAIITPLDAISSETRDRLRPIIGKYVDRAAEDDPGS